jgi:uncharacterized membrane-anchored protein YhcB (DUF1043 family)
MNGRVSRGLIVSLKFLSPCAGLLAGCAVGVSIVGMAVGKYYSQSKLNTLLRRREMPEVQYLDEDNLELVSGCTFLM